MPRSIVLIVLIPLLAGCFTQPVDEAAPSGKRTGASAKKPAKRAGGKTPIVVSRPATSPEGQVPLAPRAGEGDLVVARMKGAEIRRSDVGEFLIRFFRDQANQALNQLIDERVLEHEVKEHGITAPAGGIEEGVAAEMKRWENRVKVQFGSETTLEAYLRDRYGSTVEEHEESVRRLVRIRMLRDRLVRFDQIREDRIEARDAVFATRDEARRAAASAREGADLATLAKEDGLRPDVVLPPFSRDALASKELSDAVFALAEGEVSDPIEVVEDGRTVFHVFKVVRRMPARDLTWPEAREEVEAGLAERPLEQYEHLQWARQMRVKYEVEILR